MPSPYRAAFLDNNEDLEMEPQELPPVPNNELTEEEKTWQKRHGDLRRASQRKEKELQDQINELNRQIKDALKSSRPMGSVEDFNKWKSEFPESYAMVRAAIAEEFGDNKSEIDARFRELEERTIEQKRADALAKLRELHEDFDELRSSPKLRKWLSEQPADIVKGLTGQDTDPYLASRVLDLYKADMNETPRKREKEAASFTRRSNKSEEPMTNEHSGKKIWKESEVLRMRPEAYEKAAAEIDLARKEGRFEMDYSGGAR